MHMSVTFTTPEPGQLEDGECFAQPFYKLWGGEGQPLVDGVFDGVGPSEIDAFNDAARRIECEAECYDGENTAVIERLTAAYEMADAYDRKSLGMTRRPSVCHLVFRI